MRKSLKKLLTLGTLCSLAVSFFCGGVEAKAITWYGFPTYVKEIEKDSIIDEGVCYSDWIRLTDVWVPNREGETGHFEENYTVTVSSSISAGLTVNDLEVELEQNIEESTTTTVYAGNSAPLAKGQCCAFYYRKPYKKYKVTVNTYKVTPCYGGGSKNKVELISSETKTQKIAQEITAYDRGWFYSYDINALPEKLDGNNCSDYICDVPME